MTFILTATLAYLLGSVPFGLLLTRMAGLGDIRSVGSGNIGATNVLRTGRKDLALATLLLDSGKGAIAVGIAAAFTQGAAAPMAVAGAFAFLGHCFPIYLKFNGGKGVATFLGTLFAFNWTVGLAAAGIWLLTAVISRYSSLSALVMAMVTPFLFLVNGQFMFFAASVFMAALIFYRHRPNIERLLNGTESRIGKKG
ncbi:glycerol-3-phosphate 1-O-acyltransferase PlsY [Parvularcula sp. LCG005]|uniref:glycerol-3-phosphate 1-O-acyltransferase PlsY n=1 Tax=Parvularcula sp. LCG005 TaxID=3078805 RepID=UPI002941D1A6|nr:glycerol-3-phosphate 1-O-acyltransferase PlsY [Parvularcula sp. LCG005]WOI52745.1 glycerol-3-phosphate 1-O-acyltransferase PlsY [Parvularcula sp. LCG005]